MERLHYKIAVIDHKRSLILFDPDKNKIILREADDNSDKLSYQPNLMQNPVISSLCSDSIIFEQKK